MKHCQWTIKEYENAVKLAKSGNVQAMYDLGCYYSDGIDIKPDEKKAIFWYKKAIDLKYVSAMFNLGNLYHMMKKDKLAFKYYLMAAKKEHPKAQSCLGRCYSLGEGTKKDLILSKKWIIKAALNGNINAKKYIKENRIK